MFHGPAKLRFYVEKLYVTDVRLVPEVCQVENYFQMKVRVSRTSLVGFLFLKSPFCLANHTHFSYVVVLHT